MLRGFSAGLVVLALAVGSPAFAGAAVPLPVPKPRLENVAPIAPPVPVARGAGRGPARSSAPISQLRLADASTAAPSPMPPTRPAMPVALVADEIRYETATGRVIATGHVEVYYGQRTLTTDRIVYDSRTGTITAEGNIVLHDSSGATLFADFAQLDEQLRQGLVRGARAVMGENIRLSAVEARRVNERLSALSKAVYSPCPVCGAHPTPLWRIRARRVFQDEARQRIYYRNATFDVLGVPVFWLPWFSHPDPRVKRASGFLVPEFSHSSTYGYGVQTPYYWVIDDYSDFTFTPFLTTGDGILGIGEYRRAFASGRFETRFSGTRDDYAGKEEFHGHIQGKGDFLLPDLGFGDGYHWGFDAITVTDDGYLRRYDFSDVDRLTSELYLRRYRPDGFFDLSAVAFQSLRDNEPADQIPLVLPAFDYRRDLGEELLGGTIALFSSANVLLREEGLDTSRITLGADWKREETLSSGLAVAGFAEVRGDLFINDSFGSIESATKPRLRPLAGIEARFPLISDGPAGTSHVLEPIAQAILAPYGLNGSIANEDSVATEFDETNLFDINHFPGLDRAEEGPRLNLGLRYELISAGSLRADATMGRVLRLRSADEFSTGSGLNGSASDWVGAWMVGYDPYIRVRHRMRLENDLSVARNEIGAEMTFGRLDLDLRYVFLNADPTIAAPEDREEITAHSGFRLAPHWSVSGDLQRDLENGEFVKLGGGIRFENECCRVELSVKRQFTSSRDVPASTSVSLQVRLFTLGNNK